MSNALDLTLDQGSDFRYELTIKTDLLVPIDLTGYAFRAQARKEFSDASPAFTFTLTILNQVTYPGKVQMILLNSASAAIDLSETTKFFYDLEMVDTSSIVTKILAGKIKVNPEVTK